MAQGREPQASPARSVQPRGDTHAEASREDAYKSPKHIAEPSTCPECGAFYHAGRWTWKNPGPGHAAQVVCPACARIRDNFPAGELELSGDFVAAHRDEIDGLIHNVAETENGEHPLHRVMSIAEQGGGLLISTTDIHLPRRIGQALHDAYGGEFDFQYATGDQHIRAVWTRS